MVSRRAFLKGVAGTAAAAALPLPTAALAQAGGKLVRIVIGVPPGGSLDFVARVVAEQLREGLGRSVIVENKPGASLRIAIETVKASEPDGSTLLLTPATMLTIYPYIYKSLRYDPFKDLSPVSNVVTFDFGFAAGPATPAKTLSEFLAWAKANPKSAAFASPANGSAPHFLGVALTKAAALGMLHVPYKGAAPGVQDLLGGQIASAMMPLGDLAEGHRSGKIRVLATTGPVRSKLLADVPTFRELGFNVEGKEWYGLLAPAGTPQATRENMSQLVTKGLRRADVGERVAKLGFEPTPTTPAQFEALIKADYERWGPTVKAAGFTLDD
jgi:tripartite-type tricarboxylate transporter receptor subunit TctC